MRLTVAGPNDCTSGGTVTAAYVCICQVALAGLLALAADEKVISSTMTTAPTGGPPARLTATKPRVYAVAFATLPYAAVRFTAANPSTVNVADGAATVVDALLKATKLLTVVLTALCEVFPNSRQLWPRVLSR